jgi:hypothetical protein
VQKNWLAADAVTHRAARIAASHRSRAPRSRTLLAAVAYWLTGDHGLDVTRKYA